jgi:hypothetical protein
LRFSFFSPYLDVFQKLDHPQKSGQKSAFSIKKRNLGNSLLIMLSYIFLFVNTFYSFLKKPNFMSHNVPAVYDVLVAAIKKPVGFRRRQNVLE